MSLVHHIMIDFVPESLHSAESLATAIVSCSSLRPGQRPWNKGILPDGICRAIPVLPQPCIHPISLLSHLLCMELEMRLSAALMRMLLPIPSFIGAPPSTVHLFTVLFPQGDSGSSGTARSLARHVGRVSRVQVCLKLSLGLLRSQAQKSGHTQRATKRPWSWAIQHANVCVECPRLGARDGSVARQ